jgi:uncharacterized protein (TIRG00374 family)
MANNVLPFRAGEVLRCLAASRLAPVRFTAAVSSIAVERLFDGLAVVTLLALALFSPGLSADARVAGVSLSRAAAGAGVVCVLGLLAAGAVVAWPLASERLVRRLVPTAALAERLVRLIEGVRHGLLVLRSPGRIAAVFGWSIAHWLVNALAFWLAFEAFGLGVSFTGALLVLGVLAFGIAVPSGPSAAGVFEAVIVAALALYGVDHGRAFACALTYHVTTFFPITLLGFWSLAHTPLGLGALRRPPAP